jgi:general secretion pathway protein D
VRVNGVHILRFGLGGAALAAAILALCACMSNSHSQKDQDPPDAADVIKAADLQPRYPQATQNVNTGSSSRASPMAFFGAPVEPAPADPNVAGEVKDGFALNFENTPVSTVAKVILGDILGLSYVIDPRAQGTISLSSGRPIAKKDLLLVLESALHANNLIMVRNSTGYHIAPANEGIVGGVDRAGAGAGVEPGYGMTVIPVQYVSAQTLARLMEGFAAKPGAIRTDLAANMLVVLGSAAERQAAVDTVRNFDVDWLQGQSVGIYPVHNSAPEPLVGELEKIMDSGESGLGHNLVKFQVVARQNAVMVVASKPELLKTAATWIARLDASATANTGVKVYRVKYGEAKQLAALLSNMFLSSSGGGLESAANQIAPSSGATTLTAVDRLTGGGAKPEAPAAGAAPAANDAALAATAQANSNGLTRTRSDSGDASMLPGVRITPDIVNNAILIYADEDNYRIIERALVQLDRPKLQVAIDVTIAEVTLNDDLAYGVQFFLSNKFGSLINSSGTSTPIGETLPGFNAVLGNAASPRVVLNALHQYTNVKILSNPSLVVVDNQAATLEVGDQVPITTGTANVLSASNTIVNTVDYKNTGIILNVKPRVNNDGNVLLDIEQEISSVPPGTSLTPTISERKVKSELSVQSGQTVLLAGLISDTQNNTHSGIPVLDQIPLLGNAFSQKDNSIIRTELIMFIRPQIIRDGADASQVAEELRSKMRGGQLGSIGLPNLFAPTPKRTLQ